MKQRKLADQNGNTTNYYYGDGTRVSKTQNGIQTKYINDVGHGLTQVIMETTEANEVQAVYTYGDDLISMKRNSGISEICGYYHYDGLGSTRQMTDSNGAVVEKYSYDAFGNSTIFSPSNEPRDTSSLGNAYGYTGEQQFSEADNLVFLRARYYKPSIGRFISRDPIGYEDSMNLYQYCRNSPVNFTDPSGEGIIRMWHCFRCFRALRKFIKEGGCGDPPEPPSGCSGITADDVRWAVEYERWQKNCFEKIKKVIPSCKKCGESVDITPIL